MNREDLMKVAKALKYEIVEILDQKQMQELKALCSWNGTLKTPLLCKVCKKQFLPRRNNQACCSEACQYQRKIELLKKWMEEHAKRRIN